MSNEKNEKMNKNEDWNKILSIEREMERLSIELQTKQQQLNQTSIKK